MNLDAQQYNYREFRRGMRDLRFHGGPEPGQWAPDFDLPTIDNGRFRLQAHRGVRPVVVEFGSITCPMTLGARSALEKLFERFGDRAAFVSVYAREAHPGEIYPRHVSEPQKMGHARDWAREDGLRWPVAVDSLEGHTHRAYGALPNPVYLVDSTGRVAFRALWAGQEGLLRRKLRELLTREADGEDPVTLGEQENLLVPMLHGAAELEHAVGPGGQRAIECYRREMGGFVYGFEKIVSKISPLIHRSRPRDRF